MPHILKVQFNGLFGGLRQAGAAVSVVDRYPSWIPLVAAVIVAVAVVAVGMPLDRRANPRRTWLIMLGIWLALIGVARAGLFVSRTGQPITPNEGLLVLTDLWAAVLVTFIPAGRVLRHMPEQDLRRLRRGTALVTMFGRGGAIAVVALALATMGGLLAGEIVLAGRLPGPPAEVACQDYTTWILAPANTNMPPLADQGILAQAGRMAPSGNLKLDLTTLAGDVQLARYDSGAAQLLDMDRILSDETAVTQDCKTVPSTG